MLLDVVEGLLDVLQDDRLDRGWNAGRQPAFNVGLDAGADPHGLESFADCLAKVAGKLQWLGADVSEQSAQRVLDLVERHPQLFKVRIQVIAGGVRADPFQLELRTGKQLERIVVQRTRETPSRFVASGRDVVEKVAAGGHRLLEADSRPTELILGLLVLPEEAGGHAHQPQRPQVVRGESLW